MIKKTIKAIKEILIPPDEFKEEDVICEIDDQTVDCEGEAFTQDALNYYAPYTGVPAPAYLSEDPWFGSIVYSEKQKDYMEMETEMKIREEQQRREESSVESEDIHQKMYEIATKSWNTVAETQGGSENFHEGPGGWNSGNGMGQFQQ